MDISLTNILPVFCTAFAIALAMSPVSIFLAKKLNIMDVPKDARRMHTRSIPRFGGFAVFVSVMATLMMFEGDDERIRSAMIGGLFIYLLGIIDDKFDLHAGFKFVCQLAVALLMYHMGLRINFIENYAGSGVWKFDETLCLIITVLWIVGITNTINLIDGLDGLAAGTTAIVALCMAYVAYIHGDTFGMTIVCVALVAIAGACVGFLPFNFSPAKTFLGDGGALFLGYMIAIMSVIGPLKRSTVIAVFVPIVALAIPIFDTLFAIVRRLISGQPIMGADKGHLHHRLMNSGYGQKRSVLMLYGISGIMGMSAVLISRELYKDAFVLAAIAAVYLYVFLTGPNSATAKKEEARERQRMLHHEAEEKEK